MVVVIAAARNRRWQEGTNAMSLFGAIVRTVVNTAVIPMAVAKDVLTLGGAVTGERSATLKQVERIKREADSDYNQFVDELFRRDE